MELKLQLIIITGCIGTLIVIINMIRREKLDLKYSLLWIIICISIGLLSLFSSSIDFIANLIGVATPINAVFFLGLLAVLFTVFTLTVAESRKAKKITELTQRLAIMEDKIRKLEKYNQIQGGKKLNE